MAPLSILAVSGDIARETTVGRSAVAVGDKLRALGFEVIRARSAADGVSAILSDPLMDRYGGGGFDAASPRPAGGRERVAIGATVTRVDMVRRRPGQFIKGATPRSSTVCIGALSHAT